MTPNELADWLESEAAIPACEGLSETAEKLCLAAQQLRRIEGLEGALKKALSDLRETPELNMSNYDQDDVKRLNDGVCDVVCNIETALQEKP